jgi:hypothetical protein
LNWQSAAWRTGYGGIRQEVEHEKGNSENIRSRLREDLKDPKLKAHYQEERQALKLTITIAKLHEKRGLS